MGYNFLVMNRKAKAEAEVPLGSCFFFSLLLLCFNGEATADVGQKLNKARFGEHIQKDLESYAQKQGWQLEDLNISPWLPNKIEQLPACASGIVYQRGDKPPAGRVNYQISCEQPKWQVRASAKVSAEVAVVHAIKDIERHQVIANTMVSLKPVDLAKLNLNQSFYTRLDEVSGQQSSRRIRNGAVIASYQLEAQFLVRRGDEVLIRAQYENFTATMKGRALEDGALGEQIRVENISSGKRIEAVVVEQGVVKTRF